MHRARSFRRHLAELVVVFVGVAAAFAVENLRESLNERAVGDQYLSGFREDLTADLAMLREHQEARQAQLDNALVVREFFEGRPMDPQRFFESYYALLRTLSVAPSRNTMHEVVSSGSLRLIRDAEIRGALLDLYATYDRIARLEEHMDRDFDSYLYDPTFSAVPVRFEGPWDNTAADRHSVETLLEDVRIENGVHLLVANLEYPGTGLLDELASVRSQVERLLELVPTEGAGRTRP